VRGGGGREKVMESDRSKIGLVLVVDDDTDALKWKLICILI
jgi:hypothetical protein